MELKVGDKVKVIEKGSSYTDRIGIIYEVRGVGRSYKYAAYFGGNRSDWQPFNRCHLEKIDTRGQQLLFSFME